MRCVTYLVCGLAVLFAATVGQAAVVTLTDNFDASHDYIGGNVTGTIWNGGAYLNTATALNANTTNAGVLTIIAPNGTGWHNGTSSALLYVSTGTQDFDAAVHVPSVWAGQWSCGFLTAQKDDGSMNYNLMNRFRFAEDWSGSNFVSAVNGANNVAVTKVGTDAYIRLTRVGDLFTGYTSADGVTWVEHTSTTMSGSFRVGLSYGSFDSTPASTGAQFDNFSIAIGTVPEPSSLALLAAGLIGLIAYAWRRRKWEIDG